MPALGKPIVSRCSQHFLPKRLFFLETSC